jgi:hypothetical protein
MTTCELTRDCTPSQLRRDFEGANLRSLAGEAELYDRTAEQHG